MLPWVDIRIKIIKISFVKLFEHTLNRSHDQCSSFVDLRHNLTDLHSVTLLLPPSLHRWRLTVRQKNQKNTTTGRSADEVQTAQTTVYLRLSFRYVFFIFFFSTNDSFWLGYMQGILPLLSTANGWPHTRKQPTGRNVNEGAQTTVCRRLSFRYVFFTFLKILMTTYSWIMHRQLFPPPTANSTPAHHYRAATRMKGFETWCVSSPQVCFFSSIYIFNYHMILMSI